jgi:Xaa-Pro aminopeptidase
MDFNQALDVIEQIDSPVALPAERPAYPEFELAEYGLRHARVAALMERQGIGVLVLTSEESIRYLAGYNSLIWAAAGRWLPGGLVVARDPAASRLVVSVFDAGAAAGTAWVPVDTYGDPAELPEKLVAHARAAGGTVAVETGAGSLMHLPYALLRPLVDAIGAEADAWPILSTVRMIKSAAEIERMRAAAQAAVAGYADGLAAARPGWTEEQLLCRIGATMYANGATASSKPLFLNAVAGADRWSLADAPGSDRELRTGDLIFVDGGGPSRGYMSDIIRMASVGPLGEREQRRMDAAVAANAAMRAAARAGTTASELYAAGLAVYEDAGLRDHAGSLFGHGIGLEIWERPLIKPHDDPAEDVRLRPGMVVCVEPMLAPVENGALQGLYVVEDMVAITEGDADVLSEGLPREVATIG